VMSLAHFYQADPSYIDDVQGINPNEQRDETEMVVQPVYLRLTS